MSEATLNSVKITGKVFKEPEFCYESHGEKFYDFSVAVERTSGTIDYVPIMVSNRAASIESLVSGTLVKVSGDFRSRSIRRDEKSHLSLFVFVKELSVLEEIDGDDQNEVEIVGYVCKISEIREVSNKRSLVDFIVAVNRKFNKSSYIPMVAWSRNAKYVKSLGIGAKISIKGRIQSRDYHKRVGDNTEQRTAYEVSISEIREYIEE